MGRELARGDGDHHLVHHRDAFVHRAEPYDRAGTTLLGQVDQVPIAETLADDDSLREDVAALLEVAFHDGLDRARAPACSRAPRSRPLRQEGVRRALTMPEERAISPRPRSSKISQIAHRAARSVSPWVRKV